MLTVNQLAPDMVATSIGGHPIDLQALRGKKVLIKFHRFSGCPVAQWQLHEFINGHAELKANGIETIVLMHSSKEKILSNFKEVPGLHIVADKKKKFFKRYDSKFSWRKLFVFSTWLAIFTAIFKGYFPHFNKFEGGLNGVPSDFLLDEKGRLADLNYGSHYGDSWPASAVLKKVSNL